MQCRLHELRHKRRISVAAASKILANLVYSYKGMGLSMGTMCAGVTPSEGPALYYIDSDGTRLAGNLFCVGSGQTFAYGVLDAEYSYDLEDDAALELGRRSILAATHRDAFSGGFINLYHVKEDGWVKHGFSDTNPVSKGAAWESWQTLLTCEHRSSGRQSSRRASSQMLPQTWTRWKEREADPQQEQKVVWNMCHCTYTEGVTVVSADPASIGAMVSSKDEWNVLQQPVGLLAHCDRDVFDIEETSISGKSSLHASRGNSQNNHCESTTAYALRFYPSATSSGFLSLIFPVLIPISLITNQAGINATAHIAKFIYTHPTLPMTFTLVNP